MRPVPRDADGLSAGDKFLRAIFGTEAEAAAKKAARDAEEAARKAEAAAVRAEKLARLAAEEAEAAAKKKAKEEAWRQKCQAGVAATNWVRSRMKAVIHILEDDAFITIEEGDKLVRWKPYGSDAVKIRAAIAEGLSYQDEMSALADVLAAIINGEFEGVKSPLLKKEFL